MLSAVSLDLQRTAYASETDTISLNNTHRLNATPRGHLHSVLVNLFASINWLLLERAGREKWSVIV
jgi:hypothetical protein